MPKAAETTADFAERLMLALKILNISRAQLAAQVGVDKSLVSRWLSGQMRPTGHNLVRISEVLAKAKPGFNSLLWERPRESFEAFLGIEPENPATETVSPVEGPAVSVKTPVVAQVLEGQSAPSEKPFSLAFLRTRWWVWAALAVLAAGLFSVALWPRQQSGLSATAAAPATAAKSASIAVLPFLNMSGDPAKEYFSEGFSEELLNQLANVSQLRVASRTSSFAFKGTHADIDEVARKLHVQNVLEGSVREDGKRIRITAQLIDASNGFHVWSKVYDRDLTDVLKLQVEIADAITQALTHQLLGRVPVSAHVVDPASYTTLLRVRAYYRSFNTDSVQRGIALAREVTARDPKYAEAFSDLGEGYGALSQLDTRRTAELYPLASAAYERALALDPSNQRALSEFPDMLLLQWRWRDAVELVARTVKRQSNTEAWRAFGDIYDKFALYDDLARVLVPVALAHPEFKLAQWNAAWPLGAIGNYKGQLEHASDGLIIEPGDPPTIGMHCMALAMLGRLAEAKADLAKLANISGAAPISDSYQLCAMNIAAKSHDIGALRTLAETLAKQFPGDGTVEARAVGFVFQQAGDIDNAMVWYRRAYERRETTLFQVPYVRPEALTLEARRLFDDPRWKAMWQEKPFTDWLAVRAQVMKDPRFH